MGGTNINDDVSRLKNNKFQILVGSPGRILHLIKMNAISTKSVRLFVLDEADRLMEDSFQKDINYIYSQLPERKQLIAASATYTPDLKEFLNRYMQAPSHIMPYSSSVLLGVSQKILAVPTHGSTVRQNKIKSDTLLEILSQFPFKQCLVFCRYQVRAQTICDLLSQEGWPVKYLASSQKQAERLDSLKKLQDFSCRILVATDLAARGIDATNVDLVINLDAPENIATYLHRIGRSGRYGSKGMAITIVAAGEEESNFVNMLNSLGECNLTKFKLKDDKDSMPGPSSDIKPEQNSDSKPELCSSLPNSNLSTEKDVNQKNSTISVKSSTEQKSNPGTSSEQSKPEFVPAEKKNILDKENFSPKPTHKKKCTANRKIFAKNKNGVVEQVDLVTLMSFTPNDNFYQPFEDLENSFDKYVGNKEDCDTPRNLYDESNYKYKNYINEKNISTLTFLDQNLDIDNLENEIYNGYRTPLSLKRYPKNVREANKSEDGKDSVCDKREKRVCDKKIFNNTKNVKKMPCSSESCEESSEDFSEYLSSDYFEDESQNEGLQEYFYFKKRLENMRNQIQHSVYISTLLKNYKE